MHRSLGRVAQNKSQIIAELMMRAGIWRPHRLQRRGKIS